MEDHEADVFFAGMQEGLDYLGGVFERDGKHAGYYGIFPAGAASRVPP
jgi:hypothetical protein